MAIQMAYKSNFETLVKAAKNGDLCLMECTDKITGKIVNTVCICMITFLDNQEQYTFLPVAKMFDSNPYEELNPPE